jgi:hypothetical protein
MLNARRRIAVHPTKTTARDAACLDLHQFDYAESKADRSCIFADLLIRMVKHQSPVLTLSASPAERLTKIKARLAAMQSNVGPARLRQKQRQDVVIVK